MSKQTIGTAKIEGGKISMTLAQGMAYGALEGLDGEYPIVLDRTTNPPAVGLDFGENVAKCGLCGGTETVRVNNFGTLVCSPCRAKVQGTPEGEPEGEPKPPKTPK